MPQKHPTSLDMPRSACRLSIILTTAISRRIVLLCCLSQSLKFSYSRATIIRIGGNFYKFSVPWQYSWIGNPIRI
jgi:hypothetical protein